MGLYKAECLKIDRPFRSADELELATLSWANWFNENWLHSSIGYLTPIEKENEYYREINSPHQPALGELALHQTGSSRTRVWSVERVGGGIGVEVSRRMEVLHASHPERPRRAQPYVCDP